MSQASRAGQAGRGLLIAIEGIDGAGTTTQSRHLVDALAGAGVSAHWTREPSDGPVGLLLRRILAGAHAPVDATTLSLLFAADRADHCQREVGPAIAAGAVVVSDRWYHSSLAYQGTGAPSGPEPGPAVGQGALEQRAWIRELNRRALVPDLTLFLEVSAETAAARRAADDRSEEIFDALPLQQRIAAGYAEVMAELGAHETIRVIDGERAADAVAAQVWELVRETCQAAGLAPR